MNGDSPDPALVERLMRSLEEVSGDAVAVDREDAGPGSVGRLQVGSAVMVAYLVAIEDEFGFVWDDDVAPEVFDSFAALAAFVAERMPVASGRSAR